MSLTSGAADRGHRRPNTDPEPWEYMLVRGLRAAQQETGAFLYAPRPEYGPAANPILIDLRAMVKNGKETLQGFYEALVCGAFGDPDEAHLQHARRVIQRLRSAERNLANVDTHAAGLLTVVGGRDARLFVKIMPNAWAEVYATNYKQATQTAVLTDLRVAALATTVIRDGAAA